MPEIGLCSVTSCAQNISTHFDINIWYFLPEVDDKELDKLQKKATKSFVVTRMCHIYFQWLNAATYSSIAAPPLRQASMFYSSSTAIYP